MSAMLCTRLAFVKKNFYLFARLVLIDSAGLHLLKFHVLELYPSIDIGLDLNGINGAIIVPSN